MPAVSSLGGFFTDEWERFTKGVRLLHPDEAEAELRRQKSSALIEGAPRTISIPGWDDVIHLRPRLQPTDAQREEYWRARAAKQTPNLAPTVVAELDRRRVRTEQSRTSAAPGWNQGFSAVLTAIDNVQDFASTVATFGRLLLWTAPVLGAPLARVPDAATAARAAFLAFLDSAAGKALVAGGRADLARRLAEQAGRRAAAAIVSGAGVGLAAKLGLRLLPGLGTAILVSDILNTLSLLGMMANVGYALLCAGPKEALAAGVPMALFKRALQGEAWRWLRSNPFGQAARLRRQAKALGALPGFSNLVEVAQTTDQLFGRGASFGGLVGMLIEGANGAALLSQGTSVTIDTRNFRASFGASINEPLAERSPAELLVTMQAGRVLASAPLLFLHAEDFPDDEILLTLTAYAVAFDTVARQLRGHQWQDAFAAASSSHFVPPLALDPFTRDALTAEGIEPESGSAWPIEGAPAELAGNEYVERVGIPAGEAMSRWLLARRWSDTATYPGSLIASVVDLFVSTLDDDPELAAWELTPDSRMLHSLAEEGLIPSLDAPPEALEAFWREGAAILTLRPHQTLTQRQLLPLAAKHRVTLISSLPPDAPVPLAWRRVLE